MAVIIGCTSSRDVWTSLTRAYSHASKARELGLKDDLLSVKRGDLSISKYGQHFKAICDKLASIIRSIDSTDKSHWFLRGLGPAFSTFTAVQLAQEPLSEFDTLLARAKSHQFFQRSSDISPRPLRLSFMLLLRPVLRPRLSHKESSRKIKAKVVVRRGAISAVKRTMMHGTVLDILTALSLGLPDPLLQLIWSKHYHKVALYRNLMFLIGT
ncbi:Unknown protein [Striga hermonthica]|uniref:Uncharacterized protein n=1 Tax=Striga hermonthica TaxID=68872 RepID=A0A9N7N4H7_STRHE|nr:Unknown protein [Striga hermonthica]